MKRLIYIVGLQLLLSVSCGPEEGGLASLGPISPAYIAWYLDPVESVGNKPMLEWTTHDGTLENTCLSVYEAQFTPVWYRQDGRDFDGMLDAESYQEFLRLSTLFGDNNFNQPSTFCFNRPVFVGTLESIHMFVKPGFLGNQENQQIDSISQIICEIPYEYIKSGYPIQGEDQIIDKRDSLTVFNDQPKILFGVNFGFQFFEAPAKSDTFEFTALIRFTNGKEFEIKSNPVYLIGKVD